MKVRQKPQIGQLIWLQVQGKPSIGIVIHCYDTLIYRDSWYKVLVVLNGDVDFYDRRPQDVYPFNPSPLHI